MATLSSYSDQDPILSSSGFLYSNLFPSLSLSGGDPSRSYADVFRPHRPKIDTVPIAKKKGSWLRKSTRDWCCYRCGDVGHFASDCRNMIRCFKCGDLGHKKFNCPKLFRGGSIFELLLFNCSMICQKIIALADLYNSAFSLQDNDGGYLILSLVWHLEGLVDGILWKQKSVDLSDVFPPLPRPHERKDHALLFCLNFLKLKNLITEYVEKINRKSFEIMEEILLHFDVIISVVICGGDEVGFKTFSDVVGVKNLRSGETSKLVDVNQKNVVDAGVVNDIDFVDSSFIAEGDLIDLTGSCSVYCSFDQIDPLLLDPDVYQCIFFTGISDVNVETVVKRAINDQSKKVMAGYDWEDVQQASSAVASCAFGFGHGKDGCVVDDIGLNNRYGVLDVLERHDDDFIEISSTVSSKSSSVKMSKSKYDKDVCDFTIDRSGTPQQWSLGSDHISGEGYVVQNEDISTGSFSRRYDGTVSFRLDGIRSARLLDKDLKLFNNFGIFSKHVFDANMIKRRRNSSIMKQDLWSCMNKGIRPVFETLKQFRDPVSDGLETDLGSRYKGDLG